MTWVANLSREVVDSSLKFIPRMAPSKSLVVTYKWAMFQRGCKCWA